MTDINREMRYTGERDARPRHEVTMYNREQLRITAVVDVESFDSEEILLQTRMGYLSIRGRNLHVKNLNVESGEVAIEGRVIDLVYLDQDELGDKAKGFFSKLFK